MKGGWVDVLEATSAWAENDRAWAERLVGVAPSLFHGPGFTGAIGFITVQHDAPCTSMSVTCVPNPSWRPTAFEQEQQQFLARFGVEYLRAAYYPPAVVNLMSEMGARLPKALRDLMEEYNRRYGGADGIGVVAHPEPGNAVVLVGQYERRPATTYPHRRLLTKIGLHIEASCRLRRRPETMLAVVTPDGRIVHREKDAPDRDVLSESARCIERARTRRWRTKPEAVDLWKALVGGRASIVERREGGQRFYVVVENALPAQPFRAWNRGETDTVSLAARGFSAKFVAYALGIGETTVAARLASAATKIGVATRLELVRLAAMLTRDPRARFSSIALTTSERHVLELLAQGLSNAEIAAIRNRSVRTIANQVAQLLRKTGSVSRRALVTRT